MKRAQATTKEVLEDRNSLNSIETALANAQLAKLWWKLQPKEAKAWLKSSADALLHVPMNETQEHQAKRTQAELDVMSIALALDKEIAEELSKDAERATAEKKRLSGLPTNAVALAWVRAAYEAMGTDPLQAAAYSLEAMKRGDDQSVHSVMSFLQAKHPEAVDSYFQQAVAIAAQQNSSGMLSNLMREAYPGAGNSASAPSLSGTSRQVLLQAIAGAVTQGPSDEAARRQTCYLAASSSPLLENFSQEQAGAIQRVLQSCPQTQQREAAIDTARAECEKAGVDECLHMARQTPDMELRARLLTEALIMAQWEKPNGHCRMFDIERSMTTEERKAGHMLDMSLAQPAIMCAEEAMGNGDTALFLSLPDKVDDKDRPELEVAMAQMLVTKDLATGFRLLSGALDEMEAGKLNDPRTVLSAFNTYGKIDRSLAPSLFAKVILALNRLRLDENTHPQQMIAARFASRMDPIRLSVLLDLDPTFVDQSLATIESGRVRVALRMGLVSEALARAKTESVAAHKSTKRAEGAKSR